MPKRFVHDIDIRYEAYGRGETIVYLQSVMGGINPGAYYFAGRMSGNFRVILWDGPNCGQSGTAIKDVPSEYHLSCEYLAGLLDALGEGAVHIAGCSGGGEMGLLFAHLYPGRVKSLAMYRPTDTSCEIERKVIQARYCDRPGPTEILRNWGNWMGNPLFYRANLSDGDLRKINIPVLICPCSDDYHPERLAEDLHQNLPNSTYIPSRWHRSHDEIYGAKGEEHSFGGFVDFVDEYARYMRSFPK